MDTPTARERLDLLCARMGMYSSQISYRKQQRLEVVAKYLEYNPDEYVRANFKDDALEVLASWPSLVRYALIARGVTFFTAAGQRASGYSLKLVTPQQGIHQSVQLEPEWLDEGARGAYSEALLLQSLHKLIEQITPQLYKGKRSDSAAWNVLRQLDLLTDDVAGTYRKRAVLRNTAWIKEQLNMVELQCRLLQL